MVSRLFFLSVKWQYSPEGHLEAVERRAMCLGQVMRMAPVEVAWESSLESKRVGIRVWILVRWSLVRTGVVTEVGVVPFDVYRL